MHYFIIIFHKVIFEGVRGRNYAGDIAIDDVSLKLKDDCSGIIYFIMVLIKLSIWLRSLDQILRCPLIFVILMTRFFVLICLKNLLINIKLPIFLKKWNRLWNYSDGIITQVFCEIIVMSSFDECFHSFFFR